MADDLTRPPAAPEPGAPEASPPAQEVGVAPRATSSARREGVHARKFRLVYAVLSLVVGAAVGGLIVLTGHAGSSSGPAWSAWEPNGDSTEQMQDIAAFVARQYRTGDGARQLVAVSVERPPTVPVQQQPVKYVVLSSGSTNPNVIALSAQNTVAYNLCGNGNSCAIASGSPTVARGAQLLRREALELGLYTLKYVSGVDSVVALLPPQPGSQNRFALYFTEKALEPALDSPLSATLPAHGPLTPTSLATADTTVVHRYADQNVFSYSFGQTGDGFYIALQPPKAASAQSQTQTQSQSQSSP
jgi:hypothetical protein